MDFLLFIYQLLYRRKGYLLVNNRLLWARIYRQNMKNRSQWNKVVIKKLWKKVIISMFWRNKEENKRLKFRMRILKVNSVVYFRNRRRGSVCMIFMTWLNKVFSNFVERCLRVFQLFGKDFILKRKISFQSKIFLFYGMKNLKLQRYNSQMSFL